MFPLPGYQNSGRIFVDTEINDQLELLRQTQPGRGDRDYQPIRKGDRQYQPIRTGDQVLCHMGQYLHFETVGLRKY